MSASADQIESPSLEFIESLFSAGHSRYVANKNRGGENNQKGTCYEDFFAAHKIARLARRLLDTGEDFYLEGQVCGFVDDLVITDRATRRYSAYQLKNSPSVTWNTGDHPIQVDFLNQGTLARALGYRDVRLGLVVSDEECVRKLTPAPPDIAAFSTPKHFPYDPVIHKLLSEQAALSADFGFLSKKEQFALTDAEQVAKLLHGAWATGGRAGYVSQLVELARRMSPTLIRPLKTDEEAEGRLCDEARKILDRLEGFTYSIIRGFLSWEGLGFSGTLDYDCFNQRFIEFQQKLILKSPRTIEDIEGWLI